LRKNKDNIIPRKALGILFTIIAENVDYSRDDREE